MQGASEACIARQYSTSERRRPRAKQICQCCCFPDPNGKQSVVNATQRQRQTSPSMEGRARLLSGRGEPMFLADWDRTVMIHYAISPGVLQPLVPFQLDLRDGMAWLSIVAFTMRGMKPRIGGRLGAQLFRPIATHQFLNARAYVTHDGEPGIYFLSEWLNNLISVTLGRPIFGLPYNYGRLEYEHDHEAGMLKGTVRDGRGNGSLYYEARVDRIYAPAEPGTLTEFLMERYTAFTFWRGWQRRFRVWHEPWQQCSLNMDVLEDSLLPLLGIPAGEAEFTGANYSPGASQVWMGRPISIRES